MVLNIEVIKLVIMNSMSIKIHKFVIKAIVVLVPVFYKAISARVLFSRILQVRTS